jgi:pimeloyl-ACP methyl ester carboxylesterase
MEAMRDRPDSIEVLKTFNKPVLFVAGDKDTSIPIEISEAQFELIQNPSTHVLKNVGHMGMYEDTDQSFQAISKFLYSFQTEKRQEDGRTSILPDRDLKKNLGCG